MTKEEYIKDPKGGLKHYVNCIHWNLFGTDMYSKYNPNCNCLEIEGQGDVVNKVLNKIPNKKKILIRFWDYILNERIADRKEYNTKEQDDVLISFLHYEQKGNK